MIGILYLAGFALAATTKTLPSLTILTPKGRSEPYRTRMSTSTCGDTSAGNVYFETVSGSRNLIGWKVTQPS
jgi:hypothetical protein